MRWTPEYIPVSWPLMMHFVGKDDKESGSSVGVLPAFHETELKFTEILKTLINIGWNMTTSATKAGGTTRHKLNCSADSLELTDIGKQTKREPL